MYAYLIIFVVTALLLAFSKEYYTKYLNSRDNFYSNRSEDNLKIKDDYYTKYIIFLSLAVIFLGLVTGLRNFNVGTDLNYTYVPGFYKILNGSVNEYSERGFVLFIQMLQVFSNNARILVLSTSLIFSFCLCNIAVKKSANLYVCLLTTLLSTFYFTSLNNVRQSIAIIILIQGFNYIVDKKPIKYLICVVLAFIFHKSALIMIPIYFIINSKFINKHYLKLIILSIILLPIISKLFIYLIGFTKYAYYFNSEFNNGESNLLNIVINFLWLIISFFLLYNEKNRNKESYALLVIQTFAFLFSYLSLFMKVSELTSRIANYFIFHQILLIPYLFSREKEDVGKCVIALIYTLSYGFYMIYFIVINGYHQVLPFYF